MQLDDIAEILILYIHAPLGGIALISGGVSLFAKKGNALHKKSGKIFYYSMLFSALSALVVSLLPNHKNPFLFTIGLFSSYFIISGLRSLNFRNKDFSLRLDKIIAYAIILIGISMISYPLILYKSPNIVLTIFGIVSIIFGVRDLRNFKDVKMLKENWLKMHLGKMTGGYIAATSAFFVVNQILPGIWNWFVPAIVGSAYITYWIKKVSKKRPVPKTTQT